MSNSGQQPHILAINDSADVLSLFEDLLSAEGYRVSLGAFVVHNLDEIATMSPDLIILDYMWGGDDSGWSLLQLLRMDPRTKDIPVILCTGAVRQVTELDARLKEMGVHVILKPFDIDELTRAVKTTLASAAKQHASASESASPAE